MGLFKKKADPISERSRALQQEIAALESQIKQLSAQAEQPNVARQFEPAPLAVEAPVAIAATTKTPEGPVFEHIETTVKLQPEPIATPRIYNDLGVRKFDLPAALKRVRNVVRGQPVTNPKLVTFLAAGSIQGLRPLRYEKRVARNRFIFLSLVLGLILWGVMAVFLKQH